MPNASSRGFDGLTIMGGRARRAGARRTPGGRGTADDAGSALRGAIESAGGATTTSGVVRADTAGGAAAGAGSEGRTTQVSAGLAAGTKRVLDDPSSTSYVVTDTSMSANPSADQAIAACRWSARLGRRIELGGRTDSGPARREDGCHDDGARDDGGGGASGGEGDSSDGDGASGAIGMIGDGAIESEVGERLGVHVSSEGSRGAWPCAAVTTLTCD